MREIDNINEVYNHAVSIDDRKTRKGVGKMENTADKLDVIFVMQKALDDRIIDERNIDKSLDEWVRDITVAMEDEISEVRAEINWKWWKNEKEIDSDALKGEVIDLWHFLVSLSTKVGLSSEDVYEVYRAKNSENHSRQDGTSDKDGYEVMA